MEIPEQQFTNSLVEQGWWLRSGVPGLFGWSDAFENLVGALDATITAFESDDGAVRAHFPPLLDRRVLTRTGYMQSFPELCGSVHSFRGNEAQHQALLQAVEQAQDWGPHLSATDVVLTPAVCYPLYPTLSGVLGAGGALYSLTSYVFRHEPSADPARLQAFRMRENVRVGSSEEVRAWRRMWMERSMNLLGELGLPVTCIIASDPFFGRGGRLLRESQHQSEGKFEIVCPICSEANPTAIASFNYHQDKFCAEFAIRQPDGAVAHSACIGFGLERCALALLATHGLDPGQWPAAVRRRLSL